MGLPYKDYTKIKDGDGTVIFVSQSNAILEADKEFEAALGYKPSSKSTITVGMPCEYLKEHV